MEAVKKNMVSIIIATFNRAHLISEALASISNQSYENWECIIVDDGSTDNTEKILHPYLIGDPRFKYIRRSAKFKKGISGCRNNGLEIAQGDYIIFFDDDDIVHAENLHICLQELMNPSISFCRYEKKAFMGKMKPGAYDLSTAFSKKYVDRGDLDMILMGELAFSSCNVMWNKNCFRNQNFNEDLQYAEEWECYSRILLEGFNGVSIDKVLYFNRKHPKSNTGEFHNSDPIRIESKVKAIKLVINNLKKEGFLSSSLVKYFIRTGFLLKEYSIIDYTLSASKANILKKLKYRIGFKIYPLLRPMFVIKKKIKTKLV